MTFQQSLAVGKVGESRIAKWFIGRGFSVLPVYEIELHHGKGPRLFAPQGQIIAPDMVVFRANNCFWIEAKHKTAFTLYRKTNTFQTGIDKRHYEDYLKIDDYSPWPVWLLFLHEGGIAKDSPPSPAGLFGNALKALRECVDHPSDLYANGMVYWNIHDLKLLAEITEL